MLMQPWLSVVMPTYNGERYIARALESIAMQEAEDIETLVVDDGSDDSTLSIVETFAKRLNIRVLRRPRRGSWVRGTNEGLEASAAEHVCMLHQDDFWLPGRLSKLRSVMRENDTCALYLHPVQFVDPSDKVVGHWTCPLPAFPHVCEPNAVVGRLIVQNFIAINAPVFKRRNALQLGGLDESLWYTSDWDLWLRLAKSGRTIYVPDVLAAFRIHRGSQTVQGSARAEEFRHQLVHVLENHIRTNPELSTEVLAVARASVDLNVLLATAFNMRASPFWRTLISLIRLGPKGWSRYLRDSRLVERLGARIKVLLYRRSRT